MTNYGWVIIVGMGAVVFLSQMGTFTPSSNCEKSSYGFSQVVAVDWGVYSDVDSAAVSAENWAGDSMNITNAILSLDNGITCGLGSAAVLEPGEKGFLKLDCGGTLASKQYAAGDCYMAKLEFDYVNLRTGSADKSKGKIRGSLGRSAVVTTTTTTIPDYPPTLIIEGVSYG